MRRPGPSRVGTIRRDFVQVHYAHRMRLSFMTPFMNIQTTSLRFLPKLPQSRFLRQTIPGTLSPAELRRVVAQMID